MFYHILLLLFKKSALQGWDTVDVIHQAKVPNRTKPTHIKNEEKDKTVEDQM